VPELTHGSRQDQRLPEKSGIAARDPLSGQSLTACSVSSVAARARSIPDVAADGFHETARRAVHSSANVSGAGASDKLELRAGGAAPRCSHRCRRESLCETPTMTSAGDRLQLDASPARTALEPLIRPRLCFVLIDPPRVAKHSRRRTRAGRECRPGPHRHAGRRKTDWTSSERSPRPRCARPPTRRLDPRGALSRSPLEVTRSGFDVHGSVLASGAKVGRLSSGRRGVGARAGM